MMAFMASCDSDLWKLEDDSKGAFVPTETATIATTLEESGEYSEWVKVLNYSETYATLNSLYKGDGMMHKFTHFAPTNEALQAFYAAKQVNSVEELGKDYAKSMVLNMTYDVDSLKLTELFASDILAVSLEEPNEDNQFMCFMIDEATAGFKLVTVANLEDFKMTKPELFISVDRKLTACTNGFFYSVNGVLNPMVETVYDRVKAMGNSNIMLEALKATGYDKELAIEADTVIKLGAQEITKRAYTFLNVPDVAFVSAGINSLTDLKTAIANRSTDKSADPDALLKQYIEYHLFDGSLTINGVLNMQGSDTVRIAETLAKNQIMMVSRSLDRIETVTNVLGQEVQDTIYHCYFNTDDIDGQEIDRTTSNLRATNGTVHNLTSWMPVFEPKIATVVWDLCAYGDVRNAAGAYYQPAEPTSAEQKISLASVPCYEMEVGPEGSKNSGFYNLSYVTCKSNLKACVNNDRLVMNMGYMGSVSMRTPTLVKGKYRVSISIAYLTDQAFIRTMTGCKGGLMRVTVDGENQIMTAPYTTITKMLPGVYEAELYQEIEFSETSSHVFKFLIMDPAASTNNKFCLQFDTITFTPIE